MNLEKVIRIIDKNGGRLHKKSSECLGDEFIGARIKWCSDCPIYGYKIRMGITCREHSDKIVENIRRELRKQRLGKLLSHDIDKGFLGI